MTAIVAGERAAAGWDVSIWNDALGEAQHHRWIPAWDPDICIQCGKCAMVCPHAVIRMKVYDPASLEGAPETFLSSEARFKEFPGMKYTLQVSPEDCTGCTLCVKPARSKISARLGTKPSIWWLSRQCANRSSELGFLPHGPGDAARAAEHARDQRYAAFAAAL